MGIKKKIQATWKKMFWTNASDFDNEEDLSYDVFAKEDLVYHIIACFTVMLCVSMAAIVYLR